MEPSEDQYLDSISHNDMSIDDNLEMKDHNLTGQDQCIDNDATIDTADNEERIWGVEWSENLPPEIVILIFKYLDCTSLTRTAMTNSFWYSLFNSKDIQKAFKNECSEIFESKGLYTATKRYLVQFKDWKNMFIYRPRIRSDGIYFSEVEYWHDGLAEWGHYNPIHKVTSYLFLQFSSSGEVYYTSTPLPLDKFLNKLKRRQIDLDEGRYTVKNNMINVEIYKGNNTYCHTYEMEGKMGEVSDRFVLLSKHIINTVTQFFSKLKLQHNKAVFEFHKVKFNYRPKGM